jgi:hypothetical protein
MTGARHSGPGSRAARTCVAHLLPAARLPGSLGGAVWIEQGQNVNDGVSSVIVGSNDWAAARRSTSLAADSSRPAATASANTLSLRRQLTMYALTGNRGPTSTSAIPERFGQ